MEDTNGEWREEQLKAAEAEIEMQKREWEAERQRELLEAAEEQRQMEAEEEYALTYSSEDAKNQVKSKTNSSQSKTNSRAVRRIVSNHKPKVGGGGGGIGSKRMDSGRTSVGGSVEKGKSTSTRGRGFVSKPVRDIKNCNRLASADRSASILKNAGSNDSIRNINFRSRSGGKVDSITNNKKALPLPMQMTANNSRIVTKKVTVASLSKGKQMPVAVSGGTTTARRSLNRSTTTMATTKSKAESSMETRRSIRGKSVASNQESESSSVIVSGKNNKRRPRMPKLSTSSSVNSKSKLGSIENGHCDSDDDDEDDDNESKNTMNDNNSDEEVVDEEEEEEEEDEDDDECSLDVMIDSNDAANETDSNRTGNDNDSLSSLTLPSTSFVMATAALDASQGEGSVNSPRTRSRGSVKINLWTLDESPLAAVAVKKSNASCSNNIKPTKTIEIQSGGDSSDDDNNDDSVDEVNQSLDELKKLPVVIAVNGGATRKDCSLSQPPNKRRKMAATLTPKVVLNPDFSVAEPPLSDDGGGGAADDNKRMTRRASIMLSKESVSLNSP